MFSGNRKAAAIVRLWALLGILSFLNAPFSRCDEIDDYVKAQMRWERIPGVSIAVVRDGEVLRANGYGFSNLETSTPAAPDTVYKMGSLSKQFLAAGLMILVQDGKVSLDDSVGKYLPDVPETWKAITVRNLLTHTSGIARESPIFDPLKLQPDDEVIRSVYSTPLQFAPGSRFAYSNINYYCVAEIIRAVSGAPWADFIAQHIFAPAGLKSTRTTTVTEIVPNRASGYETSGTKLKNADTWIALRPSGAFLSTVLDLAKWDNALGSDTILTAKTRAEMWTPVRLTTGDIYGYGFGWFIDEINGHRRMRHSGGVPGFVCEMEKFPSDGLTVVVMANVGSRDLQDMAVHIAAHYQPALKPADSPSLPASNPVLSSALRSLFSDLAAGKLPADSITPKLRGELAQQKDAGVFDALQSFGPVLAIDLIQQQPKDGGPVYTLRIVYRSITLFAECSVDVENKLSQLMLHD